MRLFVAGLALLGSAALGCKSDKPRPAPSPPGSALGSAAQGGRGEARPEPYASEMLPDEADFADEADKEITAETFAAKLGELERELDDASAGEPSSADAGGAIRP